MSQLISQVQTSCLAGPFCTREVNVPSYSSSLLPVNCSLFHIRKGSRSIVVATVSYLGGTKSGSAKQNSYLLTLHNLSLTNFPVSERKNRVQAMREAAQALKVLDRTIRFHVRALCGIAVCNSSLAPAMTMASTAVTICGEHFVDDVEQREQEALLDLLVRNEAKHGWPTEAAQQHLKKIWNW